MMLPRVNRVVRCGLFLTLVGCGTKGIDIYESDPKAALDAAVGPNLKADWNIMELRLDQAPGEAPFTDVMAKASLTRIDANEVESAVEVSLVDKTAKEVSDPGVATRNTMRKMRGAAGGDFAAGNYGKASDIDFSRVRANLEVAGNMITKEGFDNAGTDHYVIRLNQDKSKIQHRFTLNAKNKNATSLQGKRIVTNYFQVDFVADREGNVTMLDSK